MENILEVSNLCKHYGDDHTRIDVLKNINLRIKKGEIITMVGKSGSGKTTLLHAIGGIEKPDSGKVIVNGQSLYDCSENKRTQIRSREIAIIFQNFNLIDEMTVLENIRLPLDIRMEKYDLEMENYLLHKFEIYDRRKYYPFCLSGGEKQRVAIIRALLTKPSIILADEPTGSLDSASGQTFLEYIEDINKELCQTFFIVTHDMDVARRGHRILTMKDGALEDCQ